ncbi:TonB-dependent receptor [Bizionia gelidisalsuginis]|uniref:TonB-dependent receptor n=1 Tax=Bizionia gelidisalsuginis TaxID=291188 RepID=A0ABY3MCH0_9FLAO|nr:outer membrane beta-barrel family protein [Bizionia gelidisalsuginis]TYC15601.1 TonB-dependent receptor [Bizionia gelidisalsuginis]
MKQLIKIAILFASVNVLAQADFSISGKIVDALNQPIAYANVIVMTADSTLIAGVSSTDKGAFKLVKLKQDTYVLKVSFLGFKTYKQAVVVSQSQILDTVVLEVDSEALSEVVINNRKPTLKKEVDRLVFNIENTSLSEGTVLSALKSTPGVLILDNSISVKNGTPSVYINNKKVHLSSTEVVQLLESSTANTIQKIEVITNPPAKYDAESGAVINIIMTKNLITGYRGKVFTNYTQGVYPRYNTGISQFYKKDNLDFNVNYSYTDSKKDRYNHETINYYDDGAIDQVWNTQLDRDEWSKTHNINFNIDYAIDDNNELNVSSIVLLNPVYDNRVFSNAVITATNNDPLYNYNSGIISDGEKENISLDLDFLHKFDNTATLKFNAHYTDYDYNRSQNVRSNYFDTNNVFGPGLPYNFQTAFNTDNSQKTNIFISKLDFNLPVSETSTFSSGVKISSTKTESNVHQISLNPEDNTALPSSAYSDFYNYDESIGSGYINFETSWDNWSFSGGLRAEHTISEGHSITSNAMVTQEYFELFPTANLSVEASENLSLYSNFKRSLERPSYETLNPFNFFLNDNTIVTGNPTLQPAFTNHFVVGTTVSGIYTFEAYYKKTKDSFYELPIQNNTDNIIVYTPVNIENTTEYGFDFVTYFNATERWFLYFVASVYNIKNESAIQNNEVKLDHWSTYGALNNDITFLKDRSLNANLSFIFVGRNLQGFRISENILTSDLSIKKTILNKKGTVSLAVSDIFNLNDYDATFRFNNQNNRSIIEVDNRYVKLGFSYTFGNTTLNTNARTREHKENERLEKQ